jgi:hypothetical protein
VSQIIQTDVLAGEVVRMSRRSAAERVATSLNRTAGRFATYRAERCGGLFCWRVVGFHNVMVHREVPADHPARPRIEQLAADWLQSRIGTEELRLEVDRLLGPRLVDVGEGLRR